MRALRFCFFEYVPCFFSQSCALPIGTSIFDKDSATAKIKRFAAAARETRMSGSIMPVIKNSGSRNQRITASVPVIVYAREKGIGEEQLYRALALSNR